MVRSRLVSALLPLVLIGVGLWLSLAGRLCDASDWVDSHAAGPFLCRAEFPLGEVRGLLDDLDGLQSDLESTLGLTVGEGQVEINLFRNRISYLRYLSNRVPEGMNRQALYVQGSDMSRVYAYRQRELDVDVRHEATHALLHNALPFVPLWLDEGLAEYFEAPRLLRASGNEHLRDLKWAIRFGWRPDLNRLENKTDITQMNGKDYRDSFAWVHFLLHGPPEAKQVLDEYFADIRDGKAPGLLSERLRAKILNAEARVVQHLKGF